MVVILSFGELESRIGLNQELSLSRPGDMRWGSHFKTILNVLSIYDLSQWYIYVNHNQCMFLTGKFFSFR